MHRSTIALIVSDCRRNVESPPEEAVSVQLRESSLPTANGGPEGPAWPDGSVKVGATVVCRGCGVTGVVVRAPAATPGGIPTCHGSMQVSAPLRCGELRRRAVDDATLAGSRYIDPVSGFAVWCTRGGPGRMHFDGRALRDGVLIASA
jgi:hypothetical protein